MSSDSARDSRKAGLRGEGRAGVLLQVGLEAGVVEAQVCERLGGGGRGRNAGAASQGT